MTATSTRRSSSRTARAEAAAQKLAAAPVPLIPSETPKAKPEPKPQPDVTVEAVPVTYYRPTVKFPDGKVVVCGHKYLHENEKAAAACGRRIAALGAFVK